MKFLVNFLIIGSTEIEAENESEARRKFQALASPASTDQTLALTLENVSKSGSHIDDIVMEDIHPLEGPDEPRTSNLD